MLEALTERSQTLMELTAASGVAVLVQDRLQIFGVCPTVAQIRSIYKRVQQPSGIFEFANLSADIQSAEEYQEIASAVLGFTLRKPIDNMLLWFRPEVNESVHWSGGPSKPVEVADADSANRLRPRTSFDIWNEEVKGKACGWDVGDLFAAADLRRYALENDLSRPSVSMAPSTPCSGRLHG